MQPRNRLQASGRLSPGEFIHSNGFSLEHLPTGFLVIQLLLSTTLPNLSINVAYNNTLSEGSFKCYVTLEGVGGWVCPSITKRYEGVGGGGLRQRYVTSFFF